MNEPVKACVIGWPIRHSRSPLIHNFWLRKHGINGVFEKKAVAPEDLHQFLENLVEFGFCGCNITIPHKTAAFDIPVIEDAATKNIGAINTVFFENGQLKGLNTDGMGFCANIASHINGWTANDQTCLIVGAGGAARSIGFSLQQQGAKNIFIYNRTQERAETLSHALGPTAQTISEVNLKDALATSDLVVNTTSLGMIGQPTCQIDLGPLPKTAIVTDIVYAPLETDLLQAAKARGLQTVDGLGMLLHQAVPGFERWFGVRPKVTEELYALVANDLNAPRPA